MEEPVVVAGSEEELAKDGVARKRRANATSQMPAYPLLLLLPLIAGLALPRRCRDYVEIFAGERAVSKGLSSLGYVGVSMDIKYNPMHDLSSPKGFIFAVFMILGIKRSGLLWLAPPCSTWVWLSRHSTKRSRACPLGAGATCTTEANLLVTRVSVLILLAWKLGIDVLVEQPQSSLMWEHPAFKATATLTGMMTQKLHMGAYGAPSIKATVLKGTALYIHNLCKTVTPWHKERIAIDGEDLTITTKNATSVTGGPDLKNTAAYPVGFGAALALLFDDAVGDVLQEEEPLTLPVLGELFKQVKCDLESPNCMPELAT